MYIIFTTKGINIDKIYNFVWILHLASSIQMTLLKQR